MGSVFGKESVAEPPFEVLLERKSHVDTTYEIRKYGVRFAATCAYNDGGDNNSPFGTLARYIGVFGTPQNEGAESISMTAPVVMENEKAKGGTAIAMTAPVVMENSGNSDGQKVMKFMLPVEYDSMSKIPKPNDPKIHIEEIPSQTGAVHRYHGPYDDKHNRESAMELGRQLMTDGVQNMTEEYMMDNFQFWGYNPPFTMPYFRRNEVWVKLTEEQVDFLSSKYVKAGLEDGASAVGVSAMKSSSYKVGMGACALLLGCYAVSVLVKSRRGNNSYRGM